MPATFPLLAIWNARATATGRSSKSMISHCFRSCFHCDVVDLLALAGRLAGIRCCAERRSCHIYFRFAFVGFGLFLLAIAFRHLELLLADSASTVNPGGTFRRT